MTGHAPWLAARPRNALPSDDVEDVLQETFLAVWKNAGTYRPRGAPSAWLWVIARNQAALLHRRRGQPTVPLPEDIAQTNDLAGPPAGRPRRLDLRRRGVRGRPRRLHRARRPHRPRRRRVITCA
ncbi:MAG TPA: RNA polymerase sigma factor [Trebonia sp.]|nr:RNA polymerase sigma factor [Trebonia sp.]